MIVTIKMDTARQIAQLQSAAGNPCLLRYRSSNTLRQGVA